MHRAENTTKQNLRIRLNQLSKVENKIIYPIHPRVKNLILKYKIKMPENITTIEPQSWLNLMKLAQASNCIITDSGGLQKEAFWLKKRCYTLRNETEWIETIQSGSNKLINLDEDEINFNYSSKSNFDNPYGNGNASKKIAKIIHNYLV
jgi:UDP-GlcNAc3NAcA epimerase